MHIHLTASLCFGRMAAADLRVLGKHGITHVVNCTENIPNFHSQKGVNYHQFPISYWPRHVKSGDKGKSCIKFVQPVFDFIDQALSKGVYVY